jgi:hypothetical protein
MKKESFAFLIVALFVSTFAFAKKEERVASSSSAKPTAIEEYLIEGLKVEDPSIYLLNIQLRKKIEQGFKNAEKPAFSNGVLTDAGKEALLSQFSPQSVDALEKIITNLGRREYPNSMLIGPAGAGKSFLIKQLVTVLSFGVFPDYLEKPLGVTESNSQFLTNIRNEYFNKTQIVSIDYDLLSRDNTRAGQAFAKADVRMRSILSDFVIAAKKDFTESGIRTLFILEEVAHLPELVQTTLKKILDDTGFKAGTTNLLEKGSEAGFSFIGVTTKGEYRKMIGGDSAVQRRYKVVNLVEPTDTQAFAIMRSKRDEWFNTHGLIINDATIAYIISMRPFFNNPPLAMPDSVLSLANDLLAWYADPIRRKHGNEITTEEAYDYLINHARLPVETWLPHAGKPPLSDLAERVKKRVVGHEAEIDQIAQGLKRGRATGFREFPVFILMGPSGSGKDSILRAFNIEMFGHDGSHLNFNLAGVNGTGLRSILEGGVTPDGEAPLLVSAMDEGPSSNGIIGFNEVKDLPSAEFSRLKAVIEEGVIRPRGKDLRDRPFGINALFLIGQYGEEMFEGKTEAQIQQIMKNLTQDQLIEILQKGSADGKTGAIPYAVIQRAVASGGLIMLRPVAKSGYKDIVEMKLVNIIRNIRVRSEVDLVVEDSLKNEIARLASESDQGTRGLDGIIKRLTETAVSEAFDMGLPLRQVEVHLSYDKAQQTVIVTQVEPDKTTKKYPVKISRLMPIASRCEELLAR